MMCWCMHSNIYDVRIQFFLSEAIAFSFIIPKINHFTVLVKAFLVVSFVRINLRQYQFLSPDSILSFLMNEYF